MDIEKTLRDLRLFVQAEHEANQFKLHEVWQKSLDFKLKSGESQRISEIKKEDANHLILVLGEDDSRFREGDMICLHQGDPFDSTFISCATIEAENDGEWLVRTGHKHLSVQDLDVLNLDSSGIYVDPDNMDLKHFYDKALDDIANSKIGTSVILPLLAGELDASFIYTDNYDDAANFAEARGLNECQIDAVGKGVAAKYLACIQGPPGTGKTKVISCIVSRLVAEGQRVLVTSHTHMAINNALNSIAKVGVPLAKVGALVCIKGLDKGIKHFDCGDDWKERPDSGYVIGATPFATCSYRLENFEFDTVIFDEASQITVALAVMAMRKAKRYVFVGDHKQLPPVVLSKSVLNTEGYSVFAKLVAGNKETSSMLNQTFRMNKQLAHWPSKKYYEGQLVSMSANANRVFSLPRKPEKYIKVFSGEHALVFIKSPGINTKASSKVEAALVVDIVGAASDAGMKLKDIGVVSPYRNHGKAIRNAMTLRFGFSTARELVTDTVERMQGQEREMIILSLCTTDPQFLSAVASFFFQGERLNVAITRPRTKLVIIGPKLADDFSVDVRDKPLSAMIADYDSLVAAAYEYTGDEE